MSTEKRTAEDLIKVLRDYNKCSDDDIDQAADLIEELHRNMTAIKKAVADVKATALRFSRDDYIEPRNATRIRVISDFDSWAIDAADEGSNCTAEIWTSWYGVPLTKQDALNHVRDFAEHIGRPDLAGTVEVEPGDEPTDEQIKERILKDQQTHVEVVKQADEPVALPSPGDYLRFEYSKVRMTVYRASQDGALVVELDTPHEDDPKVRVYVNENCVAETAPFPTEEGDA